MNTLKTSSVSLLVALLVAASFAVMSDESLSLAQTGGSDPTMAMCRTWIQENHSLDYENHGCEEYAAILNSVADQGGGVIPVGENRFFTVWFPEGWEQSPDPELVFTLHGNGGCAENNVKWWHEVAAEHDYAVVALQYAEVDVADQNPREDFIFDDAGTIYTNLITAYDELRAHCPISDVPVALHGFSRGSAMNYQLALMDRGQEGRQAFSSFVCDSGGAGSIGSAGTIPGYLRNAPPDAYDGAHFWLYCGEQDYDGQRCEDIDWMRGLILDHGGTVDAFYRNPTGGHGIFITGEERPTAAQLALFDYIDSLSPAQTTPSPTSTVGDTPSPTPTVTPGLTATPTGTASPTPSPTPIFTPIATATATLSPTPGPSPSPTLPLSPSRVYLPLMARNSGGIDVSQLVETNDDILGISDLVPGPYADAMAAGARVVNLEPMNTFFVLWVPEGYENMATRRVMVIAHGHTGNAYREVGLELDFAREHGYAIVAIQWWPGEGDAMYSGQQFYEFMDVALRYMKYKYHAQLDKCALRGWSLGSEISFEVTYLDRVSGNNRLALTISHDGGMRPNPDDMSVGKEFTRNLYDGVYGDDAFEGAHFYLYSGAEPQIGYMRNTAQVITAFGGVVERLVLDEGAGHDGFYRHPQYHEDALDIFFRLTP